jgi:hypothetical protein
MEAKAMFTVIAIVFIAVVLSQLLFVNFLLGFLLMASIGVIIIGDILIGIKISDYKPLYDPTPRGWELMELQLLDGKTVFMNTRKGAHGKRSFRIHNEDASIINDGKGTFTLNNGNRGFRAHENYDGNIDPFRAKALEKTAKKLGVKDVKEMYYQAREMLDKRGITDE